MKNEKMKEELMKAFETQIEKCNLGQKTCPLNGKPQYSINVWRWTKGIKKVRDSGVENQGAHLSRETSSHSS